MPCIHGFEEDCPICRIIIHSFPQQGKKLLDKNLELNFPLIIRTPKNKNSFKNLIPPHIQNLKPLPFNALDNLNPLQRVPQFRNKMFEERLSEIDLSKSDIHGMLNKITLLKPEIHFDEGEEEGKN
ncbi:MAG: hypothetical protein ACTSYC_08355 [Promethearchaeota archaeon]